MAPLFPPPGPAERGSPPSKVILRRYDFPPVHPRSLILFGRGVHAPLLRSCSPKRSRRAWRKPSGLEQFMGRRSQFWLVAPVDASGTSQVPWRSVPCLCPAPGPRSSRRDLASGGLLGAACNATIITPELATTIFRTRCNCRRAEVASSSNRHSGHGHCKAWPFRPPPPAAAGLTIAVAGMEVPP